MWAAATGESEEVEAIAADECRDRTDERAMLVKDLGSKDAIARMLANSYSSDDQGGRGGGGGGRRKGSDRGSGLEHAIGGMVAPWLRSSNPVIRLNEQSATRVC